MRCTEQDDSIRESAIAAPRGGLAGPLMTVSGVDQYTSA
jgi:hypothetical protein